MATIINADTSDGLKLTSDTSGQIDFQSAGSTKATIDTSGNLKFDSGFGSVGTAYGCRAWVNFNGTGTVAIRDSGNVSSITDNGTGRYQINFTTAMPDTNYSVGGCAGYSASNNNVVGLGGNPQNVSMLTTSCGLITSNIGGTVLDMQYTTVGVFR